MKQVKDLEDNVAKFFGAKYAVAVDSCTHGLELCLRMQNIKELCVPKRTYISVPFLANKLGIPLKWKEESWQDYYFIEGTNIADAAVLWRKGSYIPNTFMCLSFQFQKHLSLGRGGMILTDNKQAAEDLKNFIKKRTNEKLVELGYIDLGNYFPYAEGSAKKLDWFYHLTGGVTHTDFFAIRSTDYSKANEGEDFEDIW